MTQAIDVVSKADVEKDDSYTKPGPDKDTRLDDEQKLHKRRSVFNTSYFKQQYYKDKTREEKLEKLWEVTTWSDAVHDLYWAEQSLTFDNLGIGSHCTETDSMLSSRRKLAHTQGVVAQFSWIPIENARVQYTGFYGQKTKGNVLRFSQTSNLTEADTGLLPSVAMKFLIDGTYSQNIFGMPSFKSTNNWNFFGQNMKSRLEHFVPMDDEGDMNDQLAIDTLINKLTEGSVFAYSTAVGNPARIHPDGTKINNEDARIPWQLEFSSQYKDFDYKETNERNWIERLLEVGEVGKKILDVWAMDRPGEPLFKIAEIELDTPLITSLFGDQRMYFQHVKTNEDMDLWDKELKKASKKIDPKASSDQPYKRTWDVSPFPTDDEEAKELMQDNQDKYGCPFAWLFKSGNEFLPNRELHAIV